MTVSCLTVLKFEGIFNTYTGGVNLFLNIDESYNIHMLYEFNPLRQHLINSSHEEFPIDIQFQKYSHIPKRNTVFEIN